MTIAPYVLAACQPRTRTVFDESGRVDPERVGANVEEYRGLIARAAAEHGARLIVFPQFGLSGHAMVDNDRWVDAALDFSGEEMRRIGEAARAANAHVVVQAAERHPAFPGRYFLSAALIRPDGEVGLVYRKHYTLSLRTSPIDVHDRFVAAFGADAFFPVADTPLGRIGLTIGAEPHWPEVTRSLALHGAEVIVNPIAMTAKIDYLERAGADHVRGVRAFENMVYFVTANIGGVATAPPSEVHDYEGQVIAHGTGDRFTLATIDIERLRAARATPGAHLIAQIQPAIHPRADTLPLWPANALADAPPAGFGDCLAIEAAARRRFDAHADAWLADDREASSHAARHTDIAPDRSGMPRHTG